ncbi:MAG TPA: hypothetical protein VLK36_16580 [Gaiellaceae bacterium]|nr:hypothetical protein [Gaiellaceae bacterium]
MISRRGLVAALGAVAAGAAIVVAIAGCGGDKARSPAATRTAPAGAAATPSRSFVVYGKPKQAQSVNHADDRARGDKLLKSFNADGLPTPPSANSGKKGERAGDSALIIFVLYADRSLTRVVGSATYSCTFNFDQEAVCDGQFQIGAGTIIALGPAKFDGGENVLAVTGGTGQYAGAHGQVTSTRATGSKNTQVFRFELV